VYGFCNFLEVVDLSAGALCRVTGLPPPQGEAKGFSWQDYRDLILAAHRELSAPLVWIWDNLNIHLAPELAELRQVQR
jgi:hypothetical protein